MKTKTDLFTQHYFPFHFIFLGIAFLLLSVLISMLYTLLAVIFFIMGLLLTTTHYRVMINTEERNYRDYIWVLGYKNGTLQAFDCIEDIYINCLDRENEFGFVARLKTKKTTYAGFVKFSNEESLYIGESRDEETIMKKLQGISEIADVGVRKNY